MAWAKKARGKDFCFTIKAPGAITHEKLIGETNAACSSMADFEKSHLSVLRNQGVLGAILLQLPPYFLPEHTGKLVQLLSSFPVEEYKVFVEVRNRELHNNKDFNGEIAKHGASIVSVDSPEVKLRNNPPEESGNAYIRLHGRRYSSWWKKDAGRDERYDYEYSDRELDEIRDVVQKKAAGGDEIFIYFNNHPAGQAPRNASRMMEMLNIHAFQDKQKTLL